MEHNISPIISNASALVKRILIDFATNMNLKMKIYISFQNYLFIQEWILKSQIEVNLTTFLCFKIVRNLKR